MLFFLIVLRVSPWFRSVNCRRLTDRQLRTIIKQGGCCSISFLTSIINFENSTADCCVVSCCGVVLLVVLLCDVPILWLQMVMSFPPRLVCLLYHRVSHQFLFYCLLISYLCRRGKEGAPFLVRGPSCAEQGGDGNGDQDPGLLLHCYLGGTGEVFCHAI